MSGTDLLTLRDEKANDFQGEEMESTEQGWRLRKIRTIQVEKRPDINVTWSLDLDVSSRVSNNGRKESNRAEVFLLHEELPVFTQALIAHRIPFPTCYSQQLSRERGMYCLRLASQEPFEDFAERLSESLGVLGKM